MLLTYQSSSVKASRRCTAADDSRGADAVLVLQTAAETEDPVEPEQLDFADLINQVEDELNDGMGQVLSVPAAQ